MDRNSVLERESRSVMKPENSHSQRRMPPNAPRRTARLVLAAAAGLVAALGAIVFWPQVTSIWAEAKMGLASVIEWTRGMGPLGPVYLALIYAVACVLFLPGSILTLGSGFAFGLVWGTFAASLGSLLGVSLSFLLGRTALRRWVERLTAKNARFQALDEAVGREGFKIVLLTRLSPAFPFNVLNYGFGITRVSFRSFFFGSWIGMFPGTLLYVYLGTAAKSVADIAAGKMEGGGARTALLAVGLAATVVVTVVITRIARRALKSAIPLKRLDTETTHA